MGYVEKNTTFLRHTARCVLSSKLVMLLFAVTLVVIVINVQISIMLKDVSTTIFNRIVKIEKRDGELYGLYTRLVLAILYHYACSTIIELFKNMMAITVFRQSICDATEETVHMENAEFHKVATGKSQENITKSSLAMHQMIGTILVDIPEGLIYFVMYTSVLLQLFHPRVSFFYFLGLFVSVCFAFLITIFVNRSEARFYAVFRSSLLFLTDILVNFDIVQAYNKEKREIANYSRSLEPFSRDVKVFQIMQESLSFAQKTMLMVPHLVVVYLFIAGHDIGLLPTKVAFYNAIFMSYKGNIIGLRNFVFTLAKRSVEVESRLKRRVKDEAGCVTISDFRDAITLENADLYAGDVLINKNITLAIRKGEKIAITGYNGSGKSTFLKTLLRFHEGSTGIRIDGVPIESIQDSSVRSLIGYVSQDSHIFNNTVLYNLGYAQEKYDEQEIYRICEEYGFHTFFKNLSNGYFTQAGENGKYLSGGQKQRINFMRAIIKGAPILILDEPTSNLDRTTEAEVINSIFTCCQDRTVLIIIHNLALLDRFEKIMYFTNDGVDVFDSYEEFKCRQAIPASGP